MIGVINLNPCADKTLFLDVLPVDGIHTAVRTEVMTGGKGANVARVLKALGSSCRLWMPLGGEQGAFCARLLREEGLDFTLCTTSGQTREIVTLVGADWRQLAVKERGPVLGEAEASRVKEQALCFVREPGLDLLAICGGASCPALESLAAELVREAHRCGLRVLLDASGETLRQGMEARPDWCKPNLAEARELGLVGEPEEMLLRLNAGTPLLTLGSEGLLTLETGRPLRVFSPKVRELNPVGSGDSFVAGLLHGAERGLGFRASLALACGCGAANAETWCAARVDPRRASELAERVEFAQG